MKTPFKVAKQYRKNSLSLVDGGNTVIVEQFGQLLEYDNIKNTEAYIAKALKRKGVTRAYVKI